MVFQQFGLIPWKSALENVGFPLKLQSVSRSIRDQISSEKLALVGLDGWMHQLPQELSGGMQQRVGLARAFATEADILLMDEPFSALDPLHRKHLQDELLKLQAKLQKTIIFVTHDFSEAIRLADRIAIMESGQILQIDTPEKIIQSPNHSTVREFTSQLDFGISHRKQNIHELDHPVHSYSL